MGDQRERLTGSIVRYKAIGRHRLRRRLDYRYRGVHNQCSNCTDATSHGRLEPTTVKAMRQPRDATLVVAFAGGGTGGHVYPGIAVYERLPASMRDRALWVGSRTGVERAIVERFGITYRGVSAGKLRRYVSVQNLLVPFQVTAGFLEARRVLRTHRVDVLFSKGGFVAVPVVLAAWSLGIPVAIHESDATAGLATRLTAPFAKCVFLAYAIDGFGRRLGNRSVVVGNPIRRTMVTGRPEAAFVSFGERASRLEAAGLPLLLVLGGSLGARQINRLVWNSLNRLCASAIVVHQTGTSDTIPADAVHEHYVARPSFTDELGDLYARADLVVSRAGAGSLAEIAANRIPAVLLPLSSRISRGDQAYNARVFDQFGVATVLNTDRTEAETFASTVVGILSDRAKLGKMRESYRAVPTTDAAETIAAWLRS